MMRKEIEDIMKIQMELLEKYNIRTENAMDGILTD